MTAINWFAIPATDLDRAQRFYEQVLGRTMTRRSMGSESLALFPTQEPATGGCLSTSAECVPSQSGTVVYLDASPSLDVALARVPAAGGRITTPRTELPDGMGVFALIDDCEGNRVGLHALA